jgi:hypothetical protein
LKKLSLFGTYLSDSDEVDKLMELVRKKLILRKLQFLEWKNCYDHLKPGEANHINKLLDRILVSFPGIDLIR